MSTRITEAGALVTLLVTIAAPAVAWPHWVDPSYEYLGLVRGPDGSLWTYLRDVLVRIDPKDARVHVVGRIDPPGYPTFVGRDLYLSGPEQLRRLRARALQPAKPPRR